jgi:hypothetical protein
MLLPERNASQGWRGSSAVALGAVIVGKGGSEVSVGAGLGAGVEVGSMGGGSGGTSRVGSGVEGGGTINTGVLVG